MQRTVLCQRLRLSSKRQLSEYRIRSSEYRRAFKEPSNSKIYGLVKFRKLRTKAKTGAG